MTKKTKIGIIGCGGIANGKHMPSIKVYPLEGTYLMWVDFGAYVKPEDQKEFFTKKCRIALDYGTWFKGDGDTFARFNLATSRENVAKAADSVISALK